MRRELPPFRITLEPLDDVARKLPGFRWAPGPVGKRHRLGGKPDLLQPLDWPRCRDCGDDMSFYAQLDSLNDEITLADVGMVYVFVCFDCNESLALIQSS